MTGKALIETAADICTIRCVTTPSTYRVHMKRLQKAMPGLCELGDVLGPTIRGDQRRLTIQVHHDIRGAVESKLHAAGLVIAL